MLAGAVGSAFAQDKPPEAPQAKQQEKAPEKESRREPAQNILRLLPADSVTEHSIATAQGKLAYTATAGTLAFFDQSGNQSASVFYTAYTVKGANRPLTFAFNGGPGAASAYLHLGLVGPRILDLGPDGHDAARAALHDNPETWLRFTDLVLIDPIGTGFSRTIAAPAADAPRATPKDSGACKATPAPWPRRSRSMSRTTTGAARRNSCSARAMAACARSRQRARCCATRVSRSRAS